MNCPMSPADILRTPRFVQDWGKGRARWHCKGGTSGGSSGAGAAAYICRAGAAAYIGETGAGGATTTEYGDGVRKPPA